MKKSAIILKLVVTVFLFSSQAQAETVENCAATLAEFKAKGIEAKALSSALKHNKSRIKWCAYLKFHVEYFEEASRILRLCDHLRGSETPSLVGKAEDFLQRAKDLRSKYCGQQFAEALSIFQIYAPSEPILSH
jgi:hypothetical protein